MVFRVGGWEESVLRHAYTVLGQYLVLKKDSELFKEWMKDICNANAKQAADCYQCLNDWCEEFLLKYNEPDPLVFALEEFI
uniref:Barrier to autointegration factor n=1 Tax=Phlebotomus papatasi TaxID=29031 RepID=A0A1B0D0Z0_PHLPP